MASLPIINPDILSSLHNHLGEEIRVCSNQLAGHAGLGGVDQAVLAKIINLEKKMVRMEMKIIKLLTL